MKDRVDTVGVGFEPFSSSDEGTSSSTTSGAAFRFRSSVPQLMVGVALLTGCTSNTTAVPSVEIVNMPTDTGTKAFYALSSNAASGRTTAEAIRGLRERSGLTWDEIGKAFGVSRRAVHQWANGGRMNSKNVERLSEIVALIDTIPTQTPEEVRSRLVAPNRQGSTLLGRLIATARPAAPKRDVKQALSLVTGDLDTTPEQPLDPEVIGTD